MSELTDCFRKLLVTHLKEEYGDQLNSINTGEAINFMVEAFGLAERTVIALEKLAEREPFPGEGTFRNGAYIGRGGGGGLMADFCKACSIEIFAEDFGDLADITKVEDERQGMFCFVLCEGCGPIQVDSLGECISHVHGSSAEEPFAN